MNIKNLAKLLKDSSLEIDLDEQSLNYPILKFKIKDYNFKVFYRESFVMRSKFHKKYNTFIEITSIDEIELNDITNKLIEELKTRYCIDKNKIYTNVSKIDEDKIIDFINNF